MQGQKVTWEFNPVIPRAVPTSVKRFPAAPSSTADSAAVGAETFSVNGSLYREKVYSYYIGSGPPFMGAPPNAAYTTANAAIDGISNTGGAGITWGKWCVYITVETLVTVSDEADRSSHSVVRTNAAGLPQIRKGPPRTYFVGKYNFEDEAKSYMLKVG
jgi:hypothetical protein